MDSIRPRTLTDYINAARRHMPLILVSIVVVTAASYLAIRRLPNIYESSTFILVESPQAGAGDHSAVDLPHRLATVKQQVTGRTRLEGLIQKYGLYPEMREKEPMDSVLAQMRSDINVEVNSTRPEVTDAFTISYRAKDPQTAQNVTADLADQLIAENVSLLQSVASGEAGVLKQRADELAIQMHSMEEKAPWLISLKEDAPAAPTGTGPRVSAPPLEAIHAQQMKMGDLKDQQYKVQQQIADVDRRIADQRRIVDQQKSAPTAHDNPASGSLIARRAELQGLRDNMISKQGLTEKHPRVITIDDQIASINKALKELSSHYTSSSQTPEERELLALQSERNRLKVELEVAGREIERQSGAPVPQAAVIRGAESSVGTMPRNVGAARLGQDYLNLKHSYKDVTSKLQTAELQQQAAGSPSVEHFRINDPANLPQVPVSPNRRLLELVGLVLALGVGLALGIVAEMRMIGTIRDSRDVEYYTNLPLLAAIPRTVIPAETTRMRRIRRLKLSLAAVSAVAAVFILARVFMVVHIFEMIGKK